MDSATSSPCPEVKRGQRPGAEKGSWYFAMWVQRGGVCARGKSVLTLVPTASTTGAYVLTHTRRSDNTRFPFITELIDCYDLDREPLWRFNVVQKSTELPRYCTFSPSSHTANFA